MSFINRHQPCRDLLRIVATASFCILLPRVSFAQEHEHEHESEGHEGQLHFAHPLFTESPSPDTKIRVDYLFRQIDTDFTEHSMRLEGEYAFTHSVSIEANIPITSRRQSGTTANAVGSGEIALKLANYGLADRGILFGGGLALGVPTGNDRKAIGSAHIVELEPYVDLGYKRGEAELVSFLSYSTAVHRHVDEPNEEEFALALSGLYHVAERLETLVEFQTERVVNGEESGRQTAAIGAGVKYHVGRIHHLVLGVGGRVPVTHERESDAEIILSALWHF
ncbi:MAG TPA: hypothetical protein VM099_09825 [Gemmatimonadaceae bacterium]|nr:hypothetical protein [Gemmatimonadaceae bacterium]